MDDRLRDAFSNYFLEGGRFASILEARKYASEVLEQPIERGKAAKEMEEALESGLVRVAHTLVETAETSTQAFERLVSLYERQPNLSTRSSTSIQDQAYSTPIPLGYLVSALAGITSDDVVYEPTAGHGSLLMAANRATSIVNELDPARAADLRAQGFQVTEHDATEYQPAQTANVVVMNPPFGAVRDGERSKSWLVRGGTATPTYRTTAIDHAIALRSLQSMRDDGRAVLVLGAPMGQKTGNRDDASITYNGGQHGAFYKSLYDNYNVTQHFTVSGELYARQGTSYPVDVIVIEGRGKSVKRLPAAELPPVYRSFEALKELVPHVSLSRNQASVATSDRGQFNPSTSGRPGADRDDRNPTLAAVSGLADTASGLDAATGSTGDRLGDGARSGAASTTERPATADSGRGRGGSAEFSSVGRGADDPQFRVSRVIADAETAGRDGLPVQFSESDNQRSSSGRAGEGRNSDDNAERMAGSDGRPLPTGELEPQQLTRVEPMADETQAKQVAYRPVSKAKPGGTLLPVNMQTSVTSALRKLEGQYGSLDDYVYDRIRVEPDAMPQQFMAEQVDGIALGIANLEKGEAFILGDQTGIGKGFQLAGMIKYARERGYPVIFCTEKPKLLADIVRDLTDLGANYNILPTANSAKILLPNGDIVRTGAKQSDELTRIMQSNDLKGIDIIFTTYSQLQTVKGESTPRREFLSWAAERSMLVLDESHNAGGVAKEFATAGPMDRSEFTRMLVEKAAGGVVFSSATYAKNPHVMGLYASKTGMRFARDEESAKTLTEMIEEGGVPLQQMLAAKLAESGQYVRRERSYEGVEFGVKIAPVDHAMADSLAMVMSRILEFDELKQPAVKALKKDLKAEAKQVSIDGSTGGVGAESTNFSSLMHNVIGQSLLSIKAEAAVQDALESVRNGEKPVLALSNTMGSFIGQTADDQALQVGDTIDISFGDVLKRYLERSRDVRLKDAFGQSERRPLTDGELGYDAVMLYDETMDLIDEMDWSGLPVSPIDYIEQRLRQEGVSVDEITGRTDCIQYEADGTQIYQTRAKSEFKDIQSIGGFNDGKLDALILNRSGSTGISLHASEKVADQRPRRLIVVQPELNIDTFMQTLGRINRTGQVEQPRYTILTGDVPAEKRPTAILMKKMASLNANTTASRDSNFAMEGVTDFMNDYGDQVVLEIMGNNPELHERLGSPIDGLTEESDIEQMEAEGAIRKVTGRIPSLPVGEQEKLYSLIEREYNELVERERAMGQSILEAETLDLDAKPLARMELLSALEGNDSPFAGAVSLDVVDCKSPRMPLPQVDVINLVRTELGLEPVASVDEHDFGALENTAQANSVVAVRSFTERTNEYRRRYVKRQESALKEFEVADGVALTLEQQESKTKVEMAIAARLSKFDDRIRRQYDVIRQNLQDFQVGQTVRVVGKDGTIYYGVVQKLIDKTEGKGNPATAGNWRLQLQVADGARQITVPFTKVNTDSKTSIRVEQQSTDYGGNDIYDTFDLRQGQSREQRQIFTGNVIRAFSNFKGKLVNYKDYQGNVQQGLLMRKGFEIEKELAKAPVKMPTSEQALAFLAVATRHELKTADQNLTVKRYGNGELALLTPRPKDTGGRYYNNAELLETAQAEFFSVGNQMVMSVAPERAAAVLSLLYEQEKPLSAYSELEGARQFLGLEVPKLEALTDEMLAAMAPVVEVGDRNVAVNQLNRLFELDVAVEPTEMKNVQPEAVWALSEAGIDALAAEQDAVAEGPTVQRETEPVETVTLSRGDGLSPAESQALDQLLLADFYLLPMAQAIAVGGFESLDVALDYAVEQSLDLALSDADPYGVVTSDRVAALGLEVVGTEEYLAQIQAGYRAEAVAQASEFLLLMPADVSVDQDFRLEFETPDGVHPLVVSRVGEVLQFEQSLADGIGDDAIAVRFQIQPDNSLTLVSTFIKDNPSFEPMAAAGWLQSWIENEVPYAVMSAEQIVEATAVDELDIDAVIDAVSAEPIVESVDIDAVDELDIDAVIDTIAQPTLSDTPQPPVVEPAEAVYTAVDTLQQGVEVLWSEPETVIEPLAVQLPLSILLQDPTLAEIHRGLTESLPDTTLQRLADLQGIPLEAQKAAVERIAERVVRLMSEDGLEFQAAFDRSSKDVQAALGEFREPEYLEAMADQAAAVSRESRLTDQVQEAVAEMRDSELTQSVVEPIVEADALLTPTEIREFAQSLTDGLEPATEQQFTEAAGFAIQDVQASIERVAAQLEADEIDIDAVIEAVNQDVVAPTPIVEQVQPPEPAAVQPEARPSRDEIVDRYRQRIEQGDRTKLTKPERQQLVEHFVEVLQPLQSQSEIQSLCQAEMALLEEGYAQSSVNSVYLPTYTNAVKEGIESGRLTLTAETSYLKAWEKLAGEKGETQTHFALDYLTYDLPTQVKLRGSEAPEAVPTVELIQAEVEAIAPLTESLPTPTVSIEASLQEQAKLVAEQFSGNQQIQPEFSHSQLVDRSQLSPYLQEYLSFKDQHSASLMLKPVGSFYEAFFEDAAIVADVIGSTRTTRAISPEQAHLRVPMSGFPREDVSTVLPRLEAAGYDVLFMDELAIAQTAAEAVTVEPAVVTVESAVKQPEPVAEVIQPHPVVEAVPSMPMVQNEQPEVPTIASAEPAVDATQQVEATPVATQLPTAENQPPTVDKPLLALLVTQQLMEQHDPVTVQVMRQTQSDRYSPSLQEMRTWLTNAKELGRDQAYQDRIKNLGDKLLSGSDEVFKPIAERDLQFRSPDFTLSDTAQAAMSRDQAQLRDIEVARMSANILKAVGKNEGNGQIVFDRGDKGRFRLTQDRKTQTLTVFDKHRNEPILTVVKGKVDHEQSAVTDLDHQTFKAFWNVLQQHTKGQKVSNGR